MLTHIVKHNQFSCLIAELPSKNTNKEEQPIDDSRAHISTQTIENTKNIVCLYYHVYELESEWVEWCRVVDRCPKRKFNWKLREMEFSR